MPPHSRLRVPAKRSPLTGNPLTFNAPTSQFYDLGFTGVETLDNNFRDLRLVEGKFPVPGDEKNGCPHDNRTFFVVSTIVPRVACVARRDSIQISARSDAVMGTAQKTKVSRFLQRTASFLRSFSTTTTKLMPTSSQGASGPSGYVGLRPAPVQPVSANQAGGHIRKMTNHCSNALIELY